MMSGGPDRSKEPTIDGDEYDWINTTWRRMVCSFNKAGRGKAIKSAMSRRARRKTKQEIPRLLHDIQVLEDLLTERTSQVVELQQQIWDNTQ